MKMKLEVAATAPSQTQAELWQNMLMEAGIVATVHPGDALMPSYLGLSPNPCRVMVSEDDLEPAREVLSAALGGVDPDLPDQ